MTTIEKRYQISLKPYLKISSCCKLIGTALTEDFRESWFKMCEQYTRDTGKTVPNWGIPTEYVIQYFEIDIERIRQLAEYEKRLNEEDWRRDR